MKSKQINELKDDELYQKLDELKEELFNLRFSHATGQLSNPKEMTNCKRTIARVKTIIREREIKRQTREAK